MRGAAILICLAAPAAAQDRMSLPSGCEAYLTVQLNSCVVSHHFTCADEPKGHQRRVDVIEDGVVYSGLIDFETQWLRSYYPFSDDYEELLPDPADPASFTELVETGADTYDFRTRSSIWGEQRYVGQDNLTGEQVVIDGVTLLRTEYRIRQIDESGDVVWRATGSEYISEEWRMFLSGTGEAWTPEDGSYSVDDTPVEFVFPGEPGFLTMRPKYGCGAIMSSAEGASMVHVASEDTE